MLFLDSVLEKQREEERLRKETEGEELKHFREYVRFPCASTRAAPRWWGLRTPVLILHIERSPHEKLRRTNLLRLVLQVPPTTAVRLRRNLLRHQSGKTRKSR